MYTGTDQYQTIPLLSGIVDPNGWGTSYTYDNMQRIVNRTVQSVGTTTYLYQPGIMTTIDVMCNTTTQMFDANFSLTGSINPSLVQTTVTRNANKQETSRENYYGAMWTTAYDSYGNVSGTVDPLGNTSTVTHDSYNNATSTQTPDGAIWTKVWGYAGSSFDTTGAKRRLQASINPLGAITSYGFNGV